MCGAEARQGAQCYCEHCVMLSVTEPTTKYMATTEDLVWLTRIAGSRIAAIASGLSSLIWKAGDEWLVIYM